MVISLWPSAFQLERSQGAERLLLTAAKKSLKDRESTRHASVRIIKHLIFKIKQVVELNGFPEHTVNLCSSELSM
jgi:hypothetical protein